MSSFAEVFGTVRPDGTLELDGRPDVPPGRVRVHIEAIAEIGAGDWRAAFEGVKGIWKDRTDLPDFGELRAELDRY